MSDISSPAIGVLIDWLDSDYTSSLSFAICEEVRSRGMRSLCFVGHGLNDGGEPAETTNLVYRLAESGVVGGLIVVSLGDACPVEVQRGFIRRFAPLPMCTLAIACDGVPRVSVDNAAGMRDAVLHLIEVHGRREIAFLRGPEGNTEADQRYRGYCEALAKHSISIDPARVAVGDFSPASAGAAVSTLLDQRHVAFDALVAVNDAMAAAAMAVLTMRGVKVPQDVAVCGFDDAEAARFANPPISSVRQPWRARARLAVDALMAQRKGFVARNAVVAAEFVPRPSCGCGVSFAPIGQGHGLALAMPTWQWRKTTAAAIVGELSLRGVRLRDAPARALVECFWQQVTGKREGGFLLLLEQELAARLGGKASLSGWYEGLARLRTDCVERLSEQVDGVSVAESLMHSALERVAYAVERQQALRRLEFERQGRLLALGGQSMTNAFDARGLGRALEQQLPELGVPSFYVCAYEDSDEPLPPRSRLLLAHDATRPSVGALGEAFDTLGLLPAVAWTSNASAAFVVESLHFQDKRLGFALFEIGPRQGAIYVALREQISASLEGAALVRQVEERAIQREQAERARMAAELRIARQVQTSILPTQWQVAGMDVAAAMSPGQLPGADYFDVRPDATGAWLAVGSARGGRVSAGLLVPMLQSIVASLCQGPVPLEPGRLLEVALTVLRENVEARMQQRHYVNLLVARYQRDGRVSFAGDTEGIALCRWHGSACRPEYSIIGESPEGEPLIGGDFVLAPHDLIVMYSQGLKRSSDFEDDPIDHKGIGRQLEQCRSASVDGIRDSMLGLVNRWSGKRADLSVIVGRRVGVN